jgi:hypothetical protein
MAAQTERPSLIVRRLNTEVLSEIAKEVIIAQYAPKREPVVHAEELVYAYLPGKGGIDYERLAIICREGVGWTPNERALLPVMFHVGDGVTDALAWVGARRIQEQALTDEEVNLADFVRTFGTRLEANYMMWYRDLTAEPDAA